MLKQLIACCAALMAISISLSASELPDFGSSSSKIISLTEEQALGDDYMRQLRAFAPLVNDAEINDYIQHLGFKLVENNLQAHDRKFSFFVIRSSSINAFALPGGYIGIHTELIRRSETESELASVIGHEIAHVTQRHLARRLELQNQLSLPTLAAFAAAILIGVQSGSADAGQAAMLGTQGLAQQTIINHTRSNESEADRIGITTLYQAGFDPNGAVSFFEKMQANSRYHSNALEFLRTHPLSRSRITDARLRAQEYPKRNISDPLTYQLIKAKIKALAEKVTPLSIEQAESSYKQEKNKSLATQYEYAIFMIRAKKYAVAEEVLSNLRTSHPKQPSFAIAEAQLNIHRETPEKSVATIQQMLVNSPTNLALVETLSELYIANKQHKEARKLLLENIHMTENTPYLYKLLSEAQEGSGHRSEVYETEGNYLLQMGDLGGARIQFEQALNVHTDDPYARARINAQINRIKEYLRQRSLRH